MSESVHTRQHRLQCSLQCGLQMYSEVYIGKVGYSVGCTDKAVHIDSIGYSESMN